MFDVVVTDKRNFFTALLCLLIATSYAQIDYVDLDCNRIVEGSTVGMSSQLDSADYGACFQGDSAYNAGDKIYKLLFHDTSVIDIDFTNLSEDVQLDVFLLETTPDTTGADSTGACVATTIDGPITSLEVMPGTYWLVVDGASGGDIPVEGDFELVVVCDFAYDLIECGQIVSGSTVDKLSSFAALDIGSTCANTGDMYIGGDHLYRFDLLESQIVNITLDKEDNMDLHLFVFQTVQDGEGGFMLTSCSFSSATGGTSESVTINLNLPGTFWILVDGDQPEDVGAYSLSVRCQYDFEELDQNELTEGTTISRINYRSDYSSCNDTADYSSGDKTYIFTVTEPDTFRFILDMLTEGEDLGLVLMSSRTQGGVLVPDTCIAYSDTSSVREQLGYRLEAGTYFIVVDGSFDSEAEDQSNESDFLIIAQQGMGFPVELVSFSADLLDNAVGLQWQTASEIDFEGFRVQRSADGDNWNELGWVVGKGSPTQTAKYEFMDKTMQQGLNFYRLASVDLDGSIEFSNILSVDVSKSIDGVSVYPTLVNDHVTIVGSATDAPKTFEIYNSFGQLISKGPLGGQITDIEMSRVPSGVIYVKVYLQSGASSMFRLVRN